ncbi:MAG: RdgB/HAM1 family non-canonical purine NTP pyrophosphatase [Rickettsiales bacterium]
MIRPFPARLVAATRNEGKVGELRALLAPLGADIIAAPDVPSPEENGGDFAANALIKAEYYGKISEGAALADDSGLCVNALGGAPGVYSARWAKESGGFAETCERLRKELENIGATDYSAYFVCALCLRFPDGMFRQYRGVVKGALSFPARGRKGFGYDPIFVPEGYDRTFGELPEEVKQRDSHRAKAVAELLYDFRATENEDVAYA